MSQSKLEKNKALVLEAFDTLFNKRDYVAAERYWSPMTPLVATTTINLRLNSKRCARGCLAIAHHIG